MTALDLERVYSQEIIQRGKGYVDNVKNCIQIEDSLIAQVQGSRLYKTKVNLKTLEGNCSCPYQDNCKHAVAAYLYFKEGNSTNANTFFKNLESLEKKELIKIIKELVPKNPKLILDYDFKKNTNFENRR